MPVKGRVASILAPIAVCLIAIASLHAQTTFPTREPRSDDNGTYQNHRLEFSNSQQAIELAGDHLIWRRYTLADIILNEALETYPESPFQADMWLLRGEVALAAHDNRNASLYLMQANALAETAPEPFEQTSEIAARALYWNAIAHASDPNAALNLKAEELLRQCIDKYPGSAITAEAMYTLGELYEGRDEIDRAIDTYKQLLEQYPYSAARPLAQIRLAQTYIRQRNYSAALDQLAVPAVEQDTTRPSSDASEGNLTLRQLLLRGQCQLALKNYAAAERDLLPVAYATDSTYSRSAMLILATTYQLTGHTDSARQLYRRIASGSTDAIGAKADLLEALAALQPGENGGAESLARIASTPGHLMSDEAMVELAQRAYRANRSGEADSLLQQVISHTHSNRLAARSLGLLGAAEMLRGNYAGAITSLENCVARAQLLTSATMPERDSLIEEATLLSGIALVQEGRNTEAITRLNSYLQANGSLADAAEAKYWLGYAYFNAGLLTAAEIAFDELIALYPHSTRSEDALFGSASAKYYSRKFEPASESFAQLIKAYPLSRYGTAAAVRRADALYLLADYDQSLAAYRYVVASAPDTGAQQHARYQIARVEYALKHYTEAAQAAIDFAESYGSSALAADALYIGLKSSIQNGEDENAITALQRMIANRDTTHLLAGALQSVAPIYRKRNQPELAYALYSLAADYSRTPAQRSAAERGMKGVAELNTAAPEFTRQAAEYRGDIYLAAGRNQRAATEYQRSIDQGSSADIPWHAWMGQFHAAIALGNRQEIDTMLARIERAIERQMPKPQTLLELATLSLDNRDTARGVAWLQRERSAYPGAPETATALLLQAHISTSRHDTAAAKAALEEIVTGFAATTAAGRALLLLATISENASDTTSALGFLTQAAQRTDSLAAEALYRSGHLAFIRGDYIGASNQLNALIARFPREHRIRPAKIELGRTYEALGQSDKARQIYQDLLHDRNDDEYGKTARQRLEALSTL
jgi:TolA-binding protein